MHVTSALLLLQAAAATLYTTQPMSLSRSCQPTYKALHCETERKGGDCIRIRITNKPEWMTPLRCHHQGLLHRLATPSLPLKRA
jgi:hypothetical protein